METVTPEELVRNNLGHAARSERGVREPARCVSWRVTRSTVRGLIEEGPKPVTHGPTPTLPLCNQGLTRESRHVVVNTFGGDENGILAAGNARRLARSPPKKCQLKEATMTSKQVSPEEWQTISDGLLQAHEGEEVETSSRLVPTSRRDRMCSCIFCTVGRLVVAPSCTTHPILTPNARSIARHRSRERKQHKFAQQSVQFNVSWLVGVQECVESSREAIVRSCETDIHYSPTRTCLRASSRTRTAR